MTGHVVDDLVPNNMYSLLLPRINSVNNITEDTFATYFGRNIRGTVKAKNSHNTNIVKWFIISCTQCIEFEYSLSTHNNRTVHNDYYVHFDFSKSADHFVKKKPIHGSMKVFITSEHANESFLFRTRKNFLFIVDTVKFVNRVVWFNEIHYDPTKLKFEFHDKLVKNRKEKCYNIENDQERLECESRNEHEKYYDISENDEANEEFINSLVFKVYLYFHLKDGNTNEDLAHLFFEINEYKTGRTFYNQYFFSHVKDTMNQK
jgi:hypothetical protein